jgi:hypothetical protein
MNCRPLQCQGETLQQSLCQRALRTNLRQMIVAYCPRLLGFLSPAKEHFLQFESAMRTNRNNHTAKKLIRNYIYGVEISLASHYYIYYASTAFSEYIPVLKYTSAL